MKNTINKQAVQALSEGIRMDGRKLEDYRTLKVEKGVVATAEGSAKVTLGDTVLIAGVKLEVGTPFPDTPDVGVIMVNTECSAMSNENFKLGPPDATTVKLSRVVDRGIRESESIDLKKLCIKAGEKVWMVLVDIVTINAAGNIIDAAGIAAMAALEDTVFPEFDGDVIDYKVKTKKKLPISKQPLPVTVHKIGSKLLIDPTLDEEELLGTSLTITSIDKGNVCSLQKEGTSSLTIEEVDKMVFLGVKKAKELRKVIK